MSDEDIFRAGSEPEPSAPPPPSAEPNQIVPPASDASMTEAIESLHKEPRPRASVPSVKPPGSPADDAPPQHVPVAALHEERERRQALERRLERLEGRGQPPAEAQPEYDPSEAMFADPKAYTTRLEQQFERRAQIAELNMDLRLTAMQHGDVWKEAWDTFIDHVKQTDEHGRGKNPLDYQRVMSAASPGQEIVNWYRERQQKAEYGDDPEAYYRRKLLEDDGFMAQVAERLGAAPPAPRQAVPRDPANGRFQPSAPARLPTSLSKIPGGSAAHEGGEPAMDGSDEAIWRSANAPRRRH